MRLAAALAAGILVCSSAAAQPPEAVDLAGVMRLVREASPRLELERQGVAQAEADRITAGAYPNPTVTYAFTRPGSGQPLFEGARQQDASIALPLLLAGQRAARIERAELEIEAARARVAAGASSLAAEAGAAFVGLLAAQERAANSAAASDELGRLRAVVAGRQASGAASRYDLARVDVELGSVRARLEDARAEIADRAGTLAALLGLPGWQPRALGSLVPLGVDPAGPAPAPERAQRTPAALAAAREQAAAESGVEVARRERWPVPAVSVARSWTSEPFGASNSLGLSVELPFLDTRRGPLERARADARAASIKRQLVAAETAAHLERLEAVIASRRAALERFEEESAGRLGPLAQMAEDAYRLGRGTILELLDATRSRYELLQIRRELAAALLEAQVRLAALLGKL